MSIRCSVAGALILGSDVDSSDAKMQKFTAPQAHRLMKVVVPILQAYSDLLELTLSLQRSREEFITLCDNHETNLIKQRNELLQQLSSHA